MKLVSSAFEDNGAIPLKYTCDGDDTSPPLSWSSVPPRTRTVALVCDDPDAPRRNFTHWIVFNIPPSAGELHEGVSASPRLPDGSCQGRNDFGKVGYGGPCPPSGTHQYRFTLFALDVELHVPSSASRAEVEAAMRGHVLGQARLSATYHRH